MARTTTRRTLLSAGLFAALAGVTGAGIAYSERAQTAPDEALARTAREAEMLRIYRAASPAERRAIKQLMERMLAGHDTHAAGVECMLAFGLTKAEARERVTVALSADRTGARA